MFDGVSAVSTVISKRYNWDSYLGEPKHLIGDNIPWTNLKNGTGRCSSCRDIRKKDGEYCIECDTDGSEPIKVERDFRINYFKASPCKLTIGVFRRPILRFEDVL